MNYEKPRVEALALSIDAIQGIAKPPHYYFIDSTIHVLDATMAPHEGDE
jgi:hypothetical protein